MTVLCYDSKLRFYVNRVMQEKGRLPLMQASRHKDRQLDRHRQIMKTLHMHTNLLTYSETHINNTR